MINYLLILLLLFSFINFIFLITLCTFIVSMADVISQIRNFLIQDEILLKKEDIKEDKGLVDV